ncbi:DASS family sodium-coupled anion symporter [Spongiibacter sp. IMCC21906]|uniref:SLC13 family permease n=1 Tax=Spongiibacter sp. IMCC21906 TaxID=1620392 RepID=UPI0012E06D7A|nr:DASS family sodium-coupled anion symporter [Spongiibacter sp. IMCC21906]
MKVTRLQLMAWFPQLLGPLVFSVTLLLPAPAGLADPAWRVAGMGLWMAVWWASEAIPIPATALLPLILCPLLGIADLTEVAPAYAHPIIFLFFGGFVLGIAMQRWNLHRRIALFILKRSGGEARAQIAGFMLATAFLSMWVSNTATSVMMLPIALSVLAYHSGNSRQANNFRKTLLLAVAYSASIGGMATLIGTPPNALLAAYIKDSHGIEIGFAQWMLVGLPISLCLLVFVWWWLCRGPLPTLKAQGSDQLFNTELSDMGSISKAEQRVLTVFLLTATAWILRPLLSQYLPGLNDTVIAIIAAVAFFILPSGIKGKRLLTWGDLQSLPWGVLILFGGGLALAAVIKSSGLAEWIAQSLDLLAVMPMLFIILGLVAVIVFLTELSSNTATTAAFLPLMGALAVAQGHSPLLYAVPVALAASCAFMMPVATPPNAVVFSSGQVSIKDMVRAGLMINLFAILLLSFLGLWVVEGVLVS